jgi:hypothetical protein
VPALGLLMVICGLSVPEAGASRQEDMQLLCVSERLGSWGIDSEESRGTIIETRKEQEE